MKKGKPLQQKTPLKQKMPLKANTPLRKRSEKSAKLYAEKRVPLVKKLLTERPLCEACSIYAGHDGKIVFNIKASRDLHEVKSRGRTGGIHSTEWLDEQNILCVCRPCHRRITDNPEEAELLGLLK